MLRGVNPPALPFPRLPLCVAGCPPRDGFHRARAALSVGTRGDTFIDAISVRRDPVEIRGSQARKAGGGTR